MGNLKAPGASALCPLPVLGLADITAPHRVSEGCGPESLRPRSCGSGGVLTPTLRSYEQRGRQTTGPPTHPPGHPPCPPWLPMFPPWPQKLEHPGSFCSGTLQGLLTTSPSSSWAAPAPHVWRPLPPLIWVQRSPSQAPRPPAGGPLSVHLGSSPPLPSWHSISLPVYRALSVSDLEYKWVRA